MPAADEGEPPATTSIDLSTDSRTLQRDSADTNVPSPSDEKAPAEPHTLFKGLEAAPVINLPDAGGVEAGHAGADLEKGQAEQAGGAEKAINRKSTMSATGTMESTNPEATLAEKGEAAGAGRGNAESQMLTGMRLWTLFG